LSKGKAEILAARSEMTKTRDHFNSLRGGQEIDQGGNYYLIDPPEQRNFEIFSQRLLVASKNIGKRVLVAGCGDGLESEILALQGYELTVLDYAPGMLEDTKNRLKRVGKTAIFEEADVTDLDLTRYTTGYAGVTMAQVAQFIPPIENDALLCKAINDLTSLTPEGVFYLTTTQYDDPKFEREWIPGGQSAGTTPYYSRPAESIVQMVQSTGMKVVHHEHFDAGNTPPDNYKNDYFVAER
jgi:2-polyprenyl-3-methyl-5-hydroxy-6-metoxy-1,4-benzoquinol methylase